MGGTFDPIHFGHLMIADVIGEELSLDSVLFLPTATPPHKPHRPLASAHHRLRMVELAVGPNPRFAVSTLDLEPASPSFTVDLLDRCKAAHPDALLYFLMGADSLRDFPTWHDPTGIIQRAQLAVANRGGISIHPGTLFGMIAGLQARTHLISAPELHISASELRARVRAGKSIRYFTPDAVQAYVQEQRLYQSDSSGARSEHHSR